jgi:hypothetical protein
VFAIMGGFLSADHLIFRTFIKIYVFPILANISNNIIKLETIPNKLDLNGFSAKN